MNIEETMEAQRAFFATNATKSVPFRIDALKKLKASILKKERELYAAMKSDLNKSEFETYMTELGMVLDELRFVAKHTPGWAKNRRVHTPLAQFHSRSFQMPEPYGVVLIMSPWNYPFMLCLEPLIGAIAAGNCAVLKPSAYAPKTSQIISEIIADCFPQNYVAVVQGGRRENQDLLDQRFDYIFFTGSVSVGKLVMESAAKNLTPVSLELGGKSPCIIDKTANLKVAARRLAFGKFLNAGQTCVAPDYLFVHRSVKDQIIEYLKQEISAFYGSNPLENDSYPKIINEKHFNRLKGLMADGKILTGGETNGREQIAPTLLDGVDGDSPVMREEIFGPILPVLTFDEIGEVISFVGNREKPLALYLFTTDRAVEKRVLTSLSFGGGCVNDTIIHLATSHMGFGGVGNSGMGSYHGKFSFDTFSHYKSILKKYNWIDLPFRYLPYTDLNLKLLKLFLH
ncbi:aldehyde dehydrogenase [Caproicibacter sp. BJN0012]|uniref:aldehyde dehydrogenase n=1 Tax=Caproicibacter sp. BJN0012 TaxID=3110227 RepID=UPI002E145257